MVGRRQPPAHSPIRGVALARAVGSALRSDAQPHADVAATLGRRFGTAAVALTDSGTSALVMALRLTAGAGGTVAFPAYGCIDLAAAAVFARVRVRLYDVDPATLSPDLDSVARAVARGVDALVVVHFYGYPADVPGVARIAAQAGVPVIEDAAQGAGGTLEGVRLGALAPLSILSFGRGKGLTGGRGGALLVRGTRLAERASAMPLGPAPRGWRDVGIAAAQYLLGRPSLYAVPAAIPMLRLGEMVYSAAQEPSSLSQAAAVLVRDAMTYDDAEAAARRQSAEAMICTAGRGGGVEPVRVIDRGEGGYLRAAVRNRDGRSILSRLGMSGGYPRTLMEQQELRPQLCPGEGEHPGARELRRTLVTLPTHRFVSARERDRLCRWLSASVRPAVSTPSPSTSSAHHAAHVS
jgi:dTDP-4-amino-4,6-dideoxygalactose transaminase